MRIPLTRPGQTRAGDATLKHRRTSTAAVLLSTVLLLVAIPPTSAIVDGQPDTGSAYPNVGQIQAQFDGHWFGFCTATLIATNVVLTAAHCTFDVVFGFLQPSDLRVTFEATPGDTPTAYTVAAVTPHPDFWVSSPSPSSGINAKNYLGPGAEDIALLWLAEPVQGIAPAPVATAGYLDDLDLRNETFTTVGYGITGFTQGSLVSPVGSHWESMGTRNFSEVSILNLHDAYPDRYVKVSKANCPGDSGGPLFHGATVVAIIIWTNSLRCEAPGLDYRVDSSIAQEFLADSL
jgi:hypothetical protein